MLRIDGTNMNFSGASVIDGMQIASVNASFSNNNLYFNINIENLTQYKQNKEDVDTDIIAFREAVLTAIGE